MDIAVLMACILLFWCTYLMQYYPEVVALLSRQEQNLRILYVCLYVCVYVYYLLLTGCRALFTFNQYFVTFGSGHLRKKRGNDNRQQTVSNSLFCVYVYAKYNQTTDRARGTVVPPFPLLTILPKVPATDRDEERESEGGMATLQRLRQQKQIKWKLFAVNMHTHTHTYTHTPRVWVCMQTVESCVAVSGGQRRRRTDNWQG